MKSNEEVAKRSYMVLQCLHQEKEIYMKNPIWPPVAGLTPGLAFKGLMYVVFWFNHESTSSLHCSVDPF